MPNPFSLFSPHHSDFTIHHPKAAKAGFISKLGLT
uniref:Uncharacterized protein n=1 Tax=Anguilla anguilla TaxID=7936 RepID=A0A0E9XHE7_ANGAN